MFSVFKINQFKYDICVELKTNDFHLKLMIDYAILYMIQYIYSEV